MSKLELIGYTVRLKQAPRSILCTDGEFHHDIFVGPLGAFSAKIYKTKSRAEKARSGEVIVEEEYIYHPYKTAMKETK